MNRVTVYPWSSRVKISMHAAVNDSTPCAIYAMTNIIFSRWWLWLARVCDRSSTGFRQMRIKPTNKKDISEWTWISTEHRAKPRTFFVHLHEHRHNECSVISLTILTWSIVFTHCSSGYYVRLIQQFMKHSTMLYRQKNKRCSKNEKVNQSLLNRDRRFMLRIFLDTFPHVFMKRRTRTIVHNAGLLDTQNSVLIASTLMNTTQASSNYPEPVLDDDEDDYDSLQYQFSSYGNAALNLFREFITKLNSSEHLEFILYHWVIGNQLIIKYTNYMEDKDFVRALVSVLRVRDRSPRRISLMCFCFQLLLPDGCCHLMEVTDRSTLLTANLLLVDTDLAAPDIEGSADKSAIVIKIIFDNIEDHLRVAKLETLPTANSESLSELIISLSLRIEKHSAAL